MKNTKKALLALTCAVMLVVGSVMGTMAYLTSTDEVVNTFTVGNVKITLDEAKVDENGKEVEPEVRVKENSYKLLPGHEYDKDPTVHVDATSEDAWIFVEITNEIAAIEDEATVAAQMATNGWTLVEGETNVYKYKEVVSGGEDVVVFETIKIKGAVENEELAEYTENTIKVVAYAIQEDGFATADAAWAAAHGQFEKETPAQ
ncbi:MAG: hypothetical protein IJN37_07220 [Clostridia bacterium]|nr:hypothetical protein [Clostridia bacterium]